LGEQGRGRGFLNSAQELPNDLYWSPESARIKPGIKFSYTVWKNLPETAVELYISLHKSEAKRAFDSLKEQKIQIERSFGDHLIWDRLTDQKASRIRYVLRYGGLNEEPQWPMIQEKMVAAMERLSAAIGPHL